ncbi:hypothetical protein BGZ74_007104 [Mortierella antarctica]|nr:hypothetical protein BGZ74_007104 [Mortierella antarctica]KAG0358271.1 hypothetical protein BG005_002553 [Podila minutissima]
MLGRDPTRIEFKSDYQQEMQRATEEYIQKQSGKRGALARAKERQRQQLAATTAPPPTPADHESGQSQGIGSSTGTSTTTTERHLDPVELAQQEKRSKTTHERIGI